MPDTKLANATGAYGLAISEYMLAGVLMLRKKLHLYQKNMEQHLWKDEGEVLSIRDSVTLVVGLGDIGSQFAEKMHALGSEVIGVRKHKAARRIYKRSLSAGRFRPSASESGYRCVLYAGNRGDSRDV